MLNNPGFEAITTTHKSEEDKKSERPNIRQQNKIIAYLKERKPEILEEKIFRVKDEIRNEIIEKIAKGEIMEDDFRELLLCIKAPVNPDEPAEIFTKILGNKQMEKMVAYLVLKNANDYEKLNARDAENFLNKYPEPFSFEGDIQYFLDEIKQQNTAKKYEEYQNSKEELMKGIYGKRYEYYKQAKFLKQEALEKYPDLVEKF
ncbi:MAG: hypothetical protein UR78_C0003G0026 [Candidatus Moranbacteria bacterium GW2011_GWF2_35_39]|nr:MAG: hypothetical protein UR78_C0003G0026 [Candidatus Moranbacteria bacterium GW2011_GWF2_35_39]